MRWGGVGQEREKYGPRPTMMREAGNDLKALNAALKKSSAVCTRRHCQKGMGES